MKLKKMTVITGLCAGLISTSTLATTIGVTIYDYKDNFMNKFRNDLTADAKLQGDTKLILTDSQNDQGKQLDQVQTLLARGVDVLAINLVDPKAAKTIIRKAKQNNVPVVFFNKKPSQAALNSYDKAYYVGADAKQSGIMQGDVIADAWKKHPSWDKDKNGVINYVLIKGEMGHPDAEARTKFVIDELHKKGYKTKQLHLDTADWSTAKAKDKMDAWLAGPDADQIEVVISNNDAMAWGAVTSLKQNHKNIPVFGIDGMKQTFKYMQDGKMYGTVLNDDKNQAKAVLKLATNLANDKAADDNLGYTIQDKVIYVPYVGVSDDNLSQYIAKN